MFALPMLYFTLRKDSLDLEAEAKTSDASPAPSSYVPYDSDNRIVDSTALRAH